MRASRAYEVKHVRGGPAPALLAAPDRVDHVEIVEIDSGEVVLFWQGGDERPSSGRHLGEIGNARLCLPLSRWS
jgi:hypothetical protein